MCKKVKLVGGFTLIELLVAVSLMVLLLGTVSLIFSQTIFAVGRSNARETVYINARYALERLTDDLLGCISFDGGNQNFILENGVIDQTTGNITYGQTTYVGKNNIDNSGVHWKKAADAIVFRTTTTAGDTKQTVEVTYQLVLEADPTIRFTGTTKRPLFALKRSIRGQNTLTPTIYDQQVKDSHGNVIPDEELTHYVVSFNIEYLSSSLTFSQIDQPTPPCPGNGLFGTPETKPDPLGDGDMTNGSPDSNKTNDTTNPITIKAIRVTLVVVNGVTEQQEIPFIRVIHIPVG